MHDFGALVRRIQPMPMSPPAPVNTSRVLRGPLPCFEVPPGAKRAAELAHDRTLSTDRAIVVRLLPDKAIDTIYQAELRAGLAYDGGRPALF